MSIHDDLDNLDTIKSQLTAKRKKSTFKKSELLDTGCTTVNMACSGRPTGGFAKGRVVNLVGDSESGKSWLSMSCLASAANSPNFDDYRLDYKDIEGGVTMDVESYFGKKLAKRIEWSYPTTVEEMYDQVDDMLDEGVPFISVVDSMDSLTSDDEIDQVNKEKKARKKGKETGGSYGTSKAKANSARLRVVANRLRENGSILIILSQTRQNIGFTARFEPKTMAGGMALKFYSHHQLWLSVREFLKKEHKKKMRQIGAVTAVKVKKNRLTGKKGTVNFSFYYSAGIDDVGSCIDYLIEERHWNSGTINAKEFGVKMDRESLIAHIEDNNLESQLRKVVAEVWDGIEAATAVRRKKRYA
jgi:RecA/RadA recombinase